MHLLPSACVVFQMMQAGSDRLAGPTKKRDRNADVNLEAELKHLRAEVARLRIKLSEIHSRSDLQTEVRRDHPWIRIAATVGITFALGRMIQALRLPTAAAVAIPMITNEVNRRYLYARSAAAQIPWAWYLSRQDRGSPVLPR